MSFRAPQKIRLAVFLALVVILTLDALPLLGGAHHKAQSVLRPALDLSGLRQGSWNLFAPNSDKVNTRIRASITFTSGEQRTWHQPDWTTYSPWRRFASFRHMEYFDSVRLDQNSAAWNGLVRIIRNDLAREGDLREIASISFTRTWAEIPPPHSEIVTERPYLRFTNKYVFHVWTPEP
jgi:hypothetical protein